MKWNYGDLSLPENGSAFHMIFCFIEFVYQQFRISNPINMERNENNKWQIFKD
jgi:hypothetical protein